MAVCYREAFVGLDTALARAGQAAATAGNTGHPGSFIQERPLLPVGLGASLHSVKGSISGDDGDGSNNDDDTRGARVTERYTDEEIASMSEEEVEDVEGWTLAYDFKPAIVAMYRRFVLLPLAKVPRRSPMPRKVRYITPCMLLRGPLVLPCTALCLSSLLSSRRPTSMPSIRLHTCLRVCV